MIPEAILMKAAKPMIDSLINKIIKPKLDKFIEECGLKYDELLIPKGEHFEEYLHRTYKKYSILNTLVFKNEQKLLKDIYIPSIITMDNHHTDEKTMVKIDKYPKEIIIKYNKILITDTAGMGKSTLTKYLFLDVIENGHGIPIYIEMRRLSKYRPILLDIQEQINSLSKKFNHTLLLKLIQTGGFVFILDGYDEIPLSERSAVTTDIQDFISKANDNNIFILTSRPEQALSSFGDFQKFSINSLSKKEAYELLRKYDKQGTTSKKLIEELKTGQYEMINEFLKNPLLVSLLFAAFDYKHTIPLKKHIFYRQVYDAYFDSHDLSKGDSYIHDKSSGLDIDDFERILRFVGYKSLQYQKIEYDKSQLLSIIDEAKTYCSDLNFCSSSFLNDILTAVPLFCIDGPYYKWVHKSLQEYFAAQFIFKDAKSNQEAILHAIYKSENIEQYINLLDLYYDIDTWGFNKCILFPFCNEYVNYYHSNIFTSDIIDKEDIEHRISNLFLREICICNLKSIPEERFPLAIEEKTKQYMKNNAVYFTRFKSNICTANYFQPLLKLLPLLRKRLPELFSIKQNIKTEFKYEIPENKIINVLPYTEANNAEIYLYINYHLNSGPYSNFHNINYSECINKIMSIKKYIEHRTDVQNLLVGL